MPPAECPEPVHVCRSDMLREEIFVDQLHGLIPGDRATAVGVTRTWVRPSSVRTGSPSERLRLSPGPRARGCPIRVESRTGSTETASPATCGRSRHARNRRGSDDHSSIPPRQVDELAAWDLLPHWSTEKERRDRRYRVPRCRTTPATCRGRRA